MPDMTSSFLLLFLPFLLSLAGRAPVAKQICFVTSLLSLLMSASSDSEKKRGGSCSRRANS